MRATTPFAEQVENMATVLMKDLATQSKKCILLPEQQQGDGP